MKKLKRLPCVLKNEAGFGNVYSMVLVLIGGMFLTFLLFFFCIVLQQRSVAKDVDAAIVASAKQNYDQQYASFIQGEGYNGGTDYTETNYADAFYTALGSRFRSCSKSVVGSSTTYRVYNSSGQLAFTLQSLTLDVDVGSMPMADGDTSRLIYKVTGTLLIPVSALGYTGNVSIPISHTATYQDIG